MTRVTREKREKRKKSEIKLFGESSVSVDGADFAEEFIEVSLEDIGEVVEGEVVAVVGDAVLGEIVGADALAAVAGADL